MSAIILDPKKESLRVTCGQCGDTFEFIFEKQGEEKLRSKEEIAENIYTNVLRVWMAHAKA